MRFFHVNGRRYAAFEALGRAPGLVHAFSTRGFNVSARNDRYASERAERRALMAADFGLDAQRLCTCEQVHRTRVVVIDSPREGGGLPETDGVITNVRGQPLMVFSADCPLVLLFDPVRRVLGLVHASWRCTAAALTQNVVRTMGSRFGCRPEQMHAGIGPSAGPDEYEVGQDVYEAAADLPNRDECFRKSGGRMMFDMWLANRRQLEATGVPPNRIETAGICTMTRTDLFYSYRRDGRGCGHFGLLAAVL
jgi:YfiH family protein